MVNTAETQTTVTRSGATLLTQKSDSNTVIQKSHVMPPLVQVKKTSQESKKEEATEVLKEKPKKERHAWHGMIRNLNISIILKDIPKMTWDQTSAETQERVPELFGAGPAEKVEERCGDIATK